MIPNPLIIWRLTDGKPGHENQSLGLVNALSKLTPVEVIDAGTEAPNSSRPHIILGAGHKTHWRILKWSRQQKAMSIVLMRPSLPNFLFDLCLVPQHDLVNRKIPSNTIPTAGVLNTVSPGTKADSPPRGLFLIGGHSKEYGFNAPELHKAIDSITRQNPDIDWSLTDSRRTPADFIQSLSDLPLTLFPHQQTERGWLPAQLASASHIWVTQDSVSMIYEALTSGAKVGILPMPAARKPGRVAKGIQQLIEDQTVISYTQFQQNPSITPRASHFNEAERCAKIVLEQLQTFSILPK